MITNNNLEGIDNEFRYGPPTPNPWYISFLGVSDGDSPAIPLSANPLGLTYVTAEDTFNTWIMFKPPGGVWVPLRNYTWSWSETVTWNGATWHVTTSTSPVSTPTSSETTDPPQWTLVHANLIKH